MWTHRHNRQAALGQSALPEYGLLTVFFALGVFLMTRPHWESISTSLSDMGGLFSSLMGG